MTNALYTQICNDFKEGKSIAIVRDEFTAVNQTSSNSLNTSGNVKISLKASAAGYKPNYFKLLMESEQALESTGIKYNENVISFFFKLIKSVDFLVDVHGNCTDYAYFTYVKDLAKNNNKLKIWNLLAGRKINNKNDAKQVIAYLVNVLNEIIHYVVTNDLQAVDDNFANYVRELFMTKTVKNGTTSYTYNYIGNYTLLLPAILEYMRAKGATTKKTTDTIGYIKAGSYVFPHDETYSNEQKFLKPGTNTIIGTKLNPPTEYKANGKFMVSKVHKNKSDKVLVKAGAYNWPFEKIDKNMNVSHTLPVNDTTAAANLPIGYNENNDIAKNIKTCPHPSSELVLKVEHAGNITITNNASKKTFRFPLLAKDQKISFKFNGKTVTYDYKFSNFFKLAGYIRRAPVFHDVGGGAPSTSDTYDIKFGKMSRNWRGVQSSRTWDPGWACKNRSVENDYITSSNLVWMHKIENNKNNRAYGAVLTRNYNGNTNTGLTDGVFYTSRRGYNVHASNCRGVIGTVDSDTTAYTLNGHSTSYNVNDNFTLDLNIDIGGTYRGNPNEYNKTAALNSKRTGKDVIPVYRFDPSVMITDKNSKLYQSAWDELSKYKGRLFIREDDTASEYYVRDGNEHNKVKIESCKAIVRNGNTYSANSNNYFGAGLRVKDGSYGENQILILSNTMQGNFDSSTTNANGQVALATIGSVGLVKYSNQIPPDFNKKPTENFTIEQPTKLEDVKLPKREFAGIDDIEHFMETKMYSTNPIERYTVDLVMQANSTSLLKDRTDVITLYKVQNDIYYFTQNVFNDWLNILFEPKVLKKFLDDIKLAVSKIQEIALMTRVENCFLKKIRTKQQTFSLIDLPIGPPVVTLMAKTPIFTNNVYRASYQYEPVKSGEYTKANTSKPVSTVVNKIVAKPSKYIEGNILDSYMKQQLDLCYKNGSVNNDNDAFVYILPKNGSTVTDVTSSTSMLFGGSTVFRSNITASDFGLDKQTKQRLPAIIVTRKELPSNYSSAYTKVATINVPTLDVTYDKTNSIASITYSSLEQDLSNIKVKGFDVNGKLTEKTVTVKSGTMCYIYVTNAAQCGGKFSIDKPKPKSDSKTKSIELVNILYTSEEYPTIPKFMKLRK